ncbi:sugar transferase [Campylobacter concisus]|uniref:sugar transferase n=1 Tax=Campylobacter concisus TaxID=199 RepID=UPI0018AAA2A6|nr:sugar transferase [Campylobacter concisus]QPH99902.1 sugar transferase [Campylobacter concisus]QPI01694.1 sugar transferase [Campylobacter concisus]
MIILGEKYTFTSLELEKLRKKFGQVNFLSHENSDAKALRNALENLIKSGDQRLIVLNTAKPVDGKLVRFLTLLQFKTKYKKIKFLNVENFLEIYLQKCYIPENGENLNFLDEIRPYGAFDYALKRMIDYAGCLILFLLLFGLKFYVKRKIDEQSPGSLYFLQSRVGLDNKEFECIKFRSMMEDAEKDGAKFASENDERVFEFGEFMRKTRIDEVPQCINVFRGQMHLIGPRPERRHWINFFEKEIPYYNERHIVRPGITGWAQVNYPYGSNTHDAKQKLMYDLYYIKHWSLWLEIKIIVKTIAIIFEKKGV